MYVSFSLNELTQLTLLSGWEMDDMKTLSGQSVCTYAKKERKAKPKHVYMYFSYISMYRTRSTSQRGCKLLMEIFQNLFYIDKHYNGP